MIGFSTRQGLHDFVRAHPNGALCAPWCAHRGIGGPRLAFRDAAYFCGVEYGLTTGGLHTQEAVWC